MITDKIKTTQCKKNFIPMNNFTLYSKSNGIRTEQRTEDHQKTLMCYEKNEEKNSVK